MNVSSNHSYESYCKKWYESDSEVTINVKLTAVGLVSLFGLMANIFVITLAVKYTVRKNLHHLIIGMAVSDTLIILIVPFFYAQRITDFKTSLFPQGSLGGFLCKVTAYLYNVSYTQSLLSLMIISVERYRATGITLKRSRPYTLRHRMVVVGCSWFVPMILFAHTLYYAKLYEAKTPGVYLCKNTLTGAVPAWFFLLQPVLIIVSFLIIFTLSILTIKRLAQPHAEIRASLNERHRQKRTQRIRATIRMVLLSLLLYSCCWLPYYIYYFLLVLHKIFKGEMEVIDATAVCIDMSSLSFMAFYFLPLVNSCFSPCVYVIFLKDFRKVTLRLLCRRNTSQYSQTIKYEQRSRTGTFGTSVPNISNDSKSGDRKERNSNEIKAGYHRDSAI